MGDPWRIVFFFFFFFLGGGKGPRRRKLKKKKKIGGKHQKSEKLEKFLTGNDLKSIGNSKKSLLKAEKRT